MIHLNSHFLVHYHYSLCRDNHLYDATESSPYTYNFPPNYLKLIVVQLPTLLLLHVHIVACTINFRKQHNFVPAHHCSVWHRLYLIHLGRLHRLHDSSPLGVLLYNLKALMA